jgi:hypothetical protein
VTSFGTSPATLRIRNAHAAVLHGRFSFPRFQEGDMLDSGMINKIQKAKEYASEPERIHFSRLEVDFDGKNGNHHVGFDDGSWHCDCDYFRHHHTCSHTMAMERVLGVMAPAEAEAAALA